MKSTKLLQKKKLQRREKELNSLVPVDRETSINLKIVAKNTDAINQLHNVIKDIITLT